MNNRFSFDAAYPFRRYPWLYTLTVVVSVGIVILFVGLLLSTYYDRSSSRTAAPETSADKSDRLEVMNVLNRFHLDEGQVPLSDPPEDRVRKRREHVASALSRLKAVETQGSIESAQNDLIRLFSVWDDRLRSGQDTYDLRASFITLGKKYPWMNTLLWLIMLNRV
ncbi:MAG: hypothetical protein HY422_01530 [Candidatus Komeilibacteria bacterium]|nr:hypothetical protein [Candidatus Komeilibacteria bacterium]